MFGITISASFACITENIPCPCTSLPALPTKEGTVWLAYAETATKVWFFREPDLVEFDFSEQGTNTRTVTGSSVLKKAPKVLLDSLPKDVRERLMGPAKEQKGQPKLR